MAPRRVALASLVLAVLVVFGVRGRASGGPAGPHQVILFIGDGMGLPQITLGRLAAERLERPYPFDRFDTMGLASTRSANHVVTDSAAAATAISSGYKTNNGFLGMDASKHARKTIMEVAHAKGVATGLVTTCRITDATPAGFASHVEDRWKEDEIAAFEAASGIDVLMGGGRKFFKGARLDAMKKNGYEVATDVKELRAAKLDGKLLGLFNDEHMDYDIERDPSREPSLREMTEKAIDLLGRGGRSFLLMVEGGKIDHAGHYHDAAALVRDQLALADAIDAALERVERQGDLLVLVTGDHTTGGVGITDTIDVDGLLAAKCSAQRFTAVHKPAEYTASLDAFSRVVSDAYGFAPSAADLDFVKKANNKDYEAVRLGHVVSERRGVAFFSVEHQQSYQTVTHGHEGSLVPVFAAGRSKASFAGLYENARIGPEIARLMGLPAPGDPMTEPAKRFF
jgi:alkaline phosphatase